MNRSRPQDIAIVGMSCRFPGAVDLFAFWAEVLANSEPAGDRGESAVASIGDVVESALADAGLSADRLGADRVEVLVCTGRGCDHTAIRHEIERRNWNEVNILADARVAPIGAIDLASRALDARRADLATAVEVKADGGVGVVVLKRLADAERDGDRVYAVIKGIGLSDEADGPAARCARSIRRACRAARVKPETVGLIEARGLPAELRAARAVFPASAGGRVLSAAPSMGMDSFIKASLSLYHRIAPPTRPDDRPETLDPADGFEALAAWRPWIHGDPDAPRRAGVQISDRHRVCAHVVLEEHAASADGITPGALPDWDCEAFLLAADDRIALADRVVRLRERLRRLDPGSISLKDLAHTFNTGREPKAGRVRIGLVAGSLDELIKHLETIEPCLRNASCQRVRDARGLYFWHEPPGRESERTLAFLFPGEGSQYPGMLADLCPHFPELRAVLDTADRIARESGEAVPPSRHLFGGSSTSSPDALWATDTAVSAVLSSQWGMFQVLSRLGLRPHAVVGHSSGELHALGAAGVLDTERSLESSLSRLSAIFRRFEAEGKIPQARLTAVGVDRAKAEAVCRAHGETVVVAIDNCPHQVVLAGPPDATERVVAELRAAGAMCEDLPFSRAYHTPAFSAVLEPLEAFYAGLDFHRPKTRIYSCSNAEAMPDDPDAIRRLAAAQWTRTVAFRETVEAMYRDGLRVFVDVGARGNLCGYVEDVLRGKPIYAVAANLARRSGTKQLNHLVASLFAQGLSLDPTYLYARRRPRILDLDDEPSPPAVDHPKPERNGRHDPRPSDRTATRLVLDTKPHVATAVNGNGNENGNGHGHGRFQLVESRPTPATALLAASPRMEIAVPHAPMEPGVAIDDDAMVGYLNTMNVFLKIQGEVMAAYLQAANAECQPEPELAGAFPTPGPWAGAIVAGEPGRWIDTEYALDASEDPIAMHHALGGQRVSALEPDRKGLPVLPFFVMAEMVAQVGSLIAPSGLVLEGLEDVQAHKWVGFDPGSVLAMHGECDAEDPRRVRVSLRHRGRSGASDVGGGLLVFEGLARFAERTSEPIAPRPLHLSDPRPCRFTAHSIYDEQWLFHGPAMQPITGIGSIGMEGISGTLAVRPPDDLLRPGSPSQLLTDAVVLDGFTQILGGWGLDVFAEGDVIFPVRMGALSIHGDRPEAGASIDCRIRILETEQRRVRVDAELIGPDGRVWMRVDDWRDWRFYWPGCYRDVLRGPDVFMIGEPLPLEGVAPRDASAVWVAPPIDMARPVWRDVLERVQLTPGEQAEGLASGSELQRTHHLWGRAAAKEAVRRIWLEQGGRPRYPADLALTRDDNGRPRFHDLARPELDDLPAISIAHAEGVALALAARAPGARPGVDVVAIAEADPSNGFTPHERTLLARADRPVAQEWAARLTAAKQAAAKAIGVGPAAASGRTEARRIDLDTGIVIVHVHDHVDLIVHTNRRNRHAWAWTLGAEV